MSARTEHFTPVKIMEPFPDREAPISQDLDALQESWDELCSQYAKLVPSHEDARQRTIYEILVSTPETAGFTRVIDHFPEIRSALQDSASVHTIWVPINFDIEKLERSPSLYSESEVVLHHISPHWMPLQHILSTPNIPTMVHHTSLNGDLRIRLRPPTLLRAGNIMNVNFAATITKSDIIASNGVIHLLDKTLVLPARSQNAIMELPTQQFSMFQVGVAKTRLRDYILRMDFVGMTVFVPTNEAFCKLGSSASEFLFQTDEGCEYLRALLKFHVVPQHTLLSNAYYPKPSVSQQQPVEAKDRGSKSHTGDDDRGPPRLLKGRRRFTLPTMLSPQQLNVDIARCGGVISMNIQEGQAPVTVQDLIVSDGVIHVVSRVALPGQSGDTAPQEMSVDELKNMLKDYIQ